MRTHKYTVIIASFFCILCLLISILFEFEIINVGHCSFFINISLGLFASGFLVILASLVAYFQEKKKYYRIVFHDISNMIIYCRAIIEGMKTKDKTMKAGALFDEIKVCFNNVKINMWEYTFFIYRNKKDKIIDTAMLIIVKFLFLQNEILKLSRGLQNGNVNDVTYEGCFDIITSEMVKDYDVQLSQCELLVNETVKSLIKDRKLNSILDEKAN